MIAVPGAAVRPWVAPSVGAVPESSSSDGGGHAPRARRDRSRPGHEDHTFVQNAVREHLRSLGRRYSGRWYEGMGNGKHEDMQIPGVHIETLHNPVRYTYAQIEKACAIAQMLNRGKLVLVEPPRR